MRLRDVDPGPRRHVIIVSLGNFQKMNPTTFDIWANVLRRVEVANLVFFKYKGWEQAKGRAEAELMARGVDVARRVLWADQDPWIQHTWRKTAFDFSMDTLGKNGHTTGLDGIWAGVPNVALDAGGGGMQTRTGMSFQRLKEVVSPTVVYSLRDYEDVAVELGQDGKRRMGVREWLAEMRVERGGLFDTRVWAENFGSLLKAMIESRVSGTTSMYHISSSRVTGNESLGERAGSIALESEINNVDKSILDSLKGSTFWGSHGGAVKLHIGGQVKSQGWTVVDAQNASNVADVITDMGDLQMFKSASVEAIYSSHAFEHSPYGHHGPPGSKFSALDVLIEWERVLKMGGTLFISVPDLSVLSGLFVDERNAGDGEDASRRRFLIMRMMFGGQTDQYDVHLGGYDFEILGQYLSVAGFCQIRKVQSFGIFNDSSEIMWDIESGNTVAGEPDLGSEGGVRISLNVVAKKC